MRVENLMTQKVFTVASQDMIDRVFFLIHYEKVLFTLFCAIVFSVH
jgi:acetoin utilization protein AcuB